MRYKRWALYPEERLKVCRHEHRPFRGEIPCTGPLICTMCGLLFNPDTKEELPGQEQDEIKDQAMPISNDLDAKLFELEQDVRDVVEDLERVDAALFPAIDNLIRIADDLAKLQNG